MKTENEINNDILKSTMLINEAYPELEKYITEMPVTIPDNNNPEINTKNLNEYSDSLNALLKKYTPTHNKK